VAFNRLERGCNIPGSPDVHCGDLQTERLGRSITSTFRPASRSSRRLDWTRLR
jgi:hypothetical protein